MRKVSLAPLLLLVLIATAMALLAQVTAPVHTTFDIALFFRPPSDPRPVVAITPYFRWMNVRGSNVEVNLDELGGVSLDSSDIASRGNPVTYCLADSATMYERFGRTMRIFVLTVTDTVRVGADHGYIDLTILDMQNGTHVDTSFLVNQTGRECPGLIMEDITIGLAPFDSIASGDRTIFTWVTQTWRE